MEAEPERRRARSTAVALDAWPVLVGAVLLLPLLTRSGYPLARDLVFLPSHPWTAAVLGLGDAAPRAVPLDALVSAATTVVDGGVLARIVLPLVLAAAGWGAHRLVRELGFVPRLVAGGLAVWNPFVVERLGLGQWALLAAYAALPWLAVAAGRYRETGRPIHLASVVLWLAVASITPTGGLIGLVTALVFGARRDLRLTGALLAAGVALQLPWLLPAFVGAAGVTSDPGGVAAFAARAEGPGGVVVAVLGLGGVWDAGSVPGTRETWWGTVAAVVLLAALAVGWRRLRTMWGGADAGRWAALAAGGVLLALLSSSPWGADLLRWAVESVPGAGLLRDSQKLVAPAAVLLVAGVAAATQVLLDRAASWGSEVSASVGILALAVPFLLLPDATAAVWPTVDPVDPPSDLDRVAAIVDDSGRTAVTLPWRSYRRFDWGQGLISSDPAVRWFDTDVLVADDLRVGDATVAGESARAREVGAALERSRPADALPPLGVGWVVVYLDDPAVDDLDLTGLVERHAGADVALYEVPDAGPEPPGPGAAATWMVAIGGALAVLIVASAAFERFRLRKRGTH